MSTITFSVKDKSLHRFFGIEKEDNVRMSVSPYNLLQDVIMLPIRPELIVGQKVVFELEDETMNSRRKLVNTYEYTVMYYDSVSIKLELQNFFITS